MNELMIKGTQDFLGQAIPIVEGGFGTEKKVVLGKTIAEIHKTELKDINRIINNNINEFEFGIDILDLKQNGGFKSPLEQLGFSTRDISISKNIYLLSEQGYMKLVAMMKNSNKKKWEVMNMLIKEYFQMRGLLKKHTNEIDVLIGTLQEMKNIQNQLNQVNNRALRIESKFNDLPLLAVDSSELTTIAKRKVVSLLGGKGAPAYKIFNRKAFSDLYHELHRQFDVNKICAIKRKDLDDAKKIVSSYMLPMKLKSDVEFTNKEVVINV